MGGNHSENNETKSRPFENEFACLAWREEGRARLLVKLLLETGAAVPSSPPAPGKAWQADRLSLQYLQVVSNPPLLNRGILCSEGRLWICVASWGGKERGGPFVTAGEQQYIFRIIVRGFNLIKIPVELSAEKCLLNRRFHQNSSFLLR